MLYLAGSTNKVEFDLYLVSYKSYLVSIRIPAYTYTPAETNETNRIIKMQIKRVSLTTTSAGPSVYQSQ